VAGFLGEEEHGGAVEEAVAVVQVVGAHTQLCGPNRIANAKGLVLVMDAQVVFMEALKGEGLLGWGFNVNVLEVPGMLPHQIAAGRPHGKAQEA